MEQCLNEILMEMSQEYGIQETQLLDYAKRGCMTEYLKSLEEYLTSDNMVSCNKNECKEFVMSVIASGMSDELQNVSDSAPFNRFKYRRPEMH